MADPAKIPTEELEHIRDQGAAAYMSAYVRLMMRALKINESDLLGVNGMVVQMIEPLNHATEAIWCALMKDLVGKEQAITKFKESLNKL